MTKTFLATIVIAILVAMFHSGCEMNLGSYGDPNANAGAVQTPVQNQVANPANNTPAQATNPGTTTPPPNTGDAIDISNATIYRGSDPGGARVSRKMYSADKAGKFVNLSFSALNWPTQGSGKKVDSNVYIFWREGGRVIGGSFDAHKVDQTAKTLDNIYGGILDGHVPPSGAQVYFCLVSLDGGQRTNVAQSDANW